MSYEVFDLSTDESHGEYPTLEQARGAVAYDRLKRYSIWRDDNVRVEHCDPYDGDDERAQQGMGVWDDKQACTCSGAETGCEHSYWCPQASN